jgi:hypothetical protein
LGTDLEPQACQLETPISPAGHDVPAISVYSDIEPDIGYRDDIASAAETPDIGRVPISGFPISGMWTFPISQGYFPISGIQISGHTRYHRVGYPDIGNVPISGIPISGPISGYTDIGTNISRYRVYRKLRLESESDIESRSSSGIVTVTGCMYQVHTGMY